MGTQRGCRSWAEVTVRRFTGPSGFVKGGGGSRTWHRAPGSSETAGPSWAPNSCAHIWNPPQAGLIPAHSFLQVLPCARLGTHTLRRRGLS